MDGNNSVIDATALNNELKKELVPVTAYVGAEAVIGFIGNIVVLSVFKLRYHSCNFRYFVMCLALTDVIASCTAISGEVVTQLFWYVYPFPLVCKIKSFFNVFTVFAEAYCLLTIAVDRYRKVCKPLGWQITPRTALIICGVIYIMSTIIAFPVAIFWGTHSREINRTNIMLDGYNVDDIVRVNVTICEIDQAYLGQSAPRIYTYCLETLISLSLIPMFLLYIFVARTLIGSSKALDKRRTSVHKSDKRNRTKYDDKSDVDKTDDESIAYSSQIVGSVSKTALPGTLGSVSKTALPGTLSPEKSDDVDLDSSTANSMTTTQMAGGYSESSFQDKPRKGTIKSRKHRKMVSSRVRRKTLIMFVLTVIFMVTTITYLTMLGLIAGDILETLSDSEKATYFFFFRFYFINHVINPLVYGLLDPQFQKVMGDVYRKIRGVFCSRGKDNDIEK